MSLTRELSHYGVNARSRSVRWLRNEATPELLDYLDLVEPKSTRDSQAIMPDGVAENQDRPLLYFLDAGRLATDAKLQDEQVAGLQRALACRGDRAYLAIVRPGTLDVVPVSLDQQTPQWRKYQAGTPEALTFFSRLALGRCEELPGGPDVDFLFQEMFQLVDRTATRLDQLRLRRSDILSLVGRALFFRFLIDRGIVKEADLKRIAPKAGALAQCFDNAENAAATSAWLDRTFNGDFLPLTDNGSREYFESVGQRTGQRVFFHLGGITRGDEPQGDDGFQLRLPIHWGHLNFAHIPVGLLSQVYERLSWKWDDHNARSTSVHYTPRNIAATLVGEAFDAMADAVAARVLDPACGAGVFLVIAFRRLYRERWKVQGRRPDTAAIRGILEQQLVGFDISDSALKLCALSLYLTAIELDPDPVPPEKLRFRALRHGRQAILHDWRQPTDPAVGPVVGSLGHHVGREFDGKFDLVLCNPPWTNIGKKYQTVAAQLDQLSREIVSSLDTEIGATYQNPDYVPDLPFLWRSLRWSKPDGRIAMALPARTLFKQGRAAWATREAIFRLIEVTGIINCSNLRKTKVWPDMDQPFMLLFARNRRPKSGHRLPFISPHTDLPLNRLGEVRIDAKSAQPILVEDALAEPWLWKALAVGSALDVEVMRKLKAAGGEPLKAYWVDQLALSCRTGYQIRPDQPQQSARSLHGLRNLDRPDQFRFSVTPGDLEYFSRQTLCWPRLESGSDPLRVYRAPLVLVNASPGDDRTQGRALLSLTDVAYNESFYGYSAAGHPQGELLARYLHLFMHSNLVLYSALLTSAEIGIERPKFQKQDFDKFIIQPLERLDRADIARIEPLSRRLLRGDATVFAEIDAFFGRSYGLNAQDMQVIADTLEVREPNDELGLRASQPPTKAEINAFCRKVDALLAPFFKRLDLQAETVVWQPGQGTEAPFVFLSLGPKQNGAQPPDRVWESVLTLANETGATRVICPTKNGLLIGLLRQYRYWTPSRARMLAAEIIRQHLGVFE